MAQLVKAKKRFITFVQEHTNCKQRKADNGSITNQNRAEQIIWLFRCFNKNVLLGGNKTGSFQLRVNLDDQ